MDKPCVICDKPTPKTVAVSPAVWQLSKEEMDHIVKIRMEGADAAAVREQAFVLSGRTLRVCSRGCFVILREDILNKFLFYKFEPEFSSDELLAALLERGPKGEASESTPAAAVPEEFRGGEHVD